MTHLNLPEQWRYGGVDLSTYATLVQRVDGVDDFAELRGDNIMIPSIAGRRWARKRRDQKRVALAIWVNSLTAAGAEPGNNATQARANLDSLNALFATNAEAALDRVMPDGSTRTTRAEVVGLNSMVGSELSGEAMGLVVDFLLADPHFYGTAVEVTQAVTASPTNFTVTNPGSVANHRLLLTFTGPISNPRLLNLRIDPTGGYYVEALVTVAATKQLVIDCAAFTALNDGVNAIGSIRHSGGFEFMRLEAGSNSLRVTATTPGGTLKIGYSPSYV